MDALIGHTGFVGSTIARSRRFDAYFRSTDIDTIRGAEFKLVVCCGVRAEKWKANRDPGTDRAGITRLTEALKTVKVQEVVLVSTVDVYPHPVAVDEATLIEPDEAQPYGRHRFELERFCADHFSTTVVRLPALYGPGLKKNAVYDLLHDHQVDSIHPSARFQFYDVTRVWEDIERIRSARIPLVNITAVPVTMAQVASDAFGRELSGRTAGPPSRYDVRSLHAGLVGGSGGYWFDRATALRGIARLVRDRAIP